MLDAYRVPDRLQLEEVGDVPRALVVRLAAHDALDVLGSEALQLLRLSVRAGEVDRVQVHVPGEPGRELVAMTGEEVDDTGWDVRRGEHLGELDRGERRGLGGDDHRCVSADDGGRDPRDQ